MVWVVEGRVVAIMESLWWRKTMGWDLTEGLDIYRKKGRKWDLYNGDRVARIGGSFQPGVGE